MMNLKEKVRVIEDYPAPGVIYRDIAPILQDAAALRELIERMKGILQNHTVDLVAAPEVRGFALGGAMAYSLGAGFVPVRRGGRLPGEVLQYQYPIAAGRTDTLEIYRDTIRPGQTCVVVDDLLATGSTALATCALLEQAGARVLGLCFAMEMTAYAGRDKLIGYEVYSAMKY